MSTFILGVCIGGLVVAFAAVAFSGLMIKLLSTKDPNETLVIDGQVCEGDK